MKILDEISLFLKLKKQLKNFDMKNWKTSLAGILQLALVAGHMFLPAVFTPEFTLALTGVVSGLGLHLASDSTPNLNQK